MLLHGSGSDSDSGRFDVFNGRTRTSADAHTHTHARALFPILNYVLFAYVPSYSSASVTLAQRVDVGGEAAVGAKVTVKFEYMRRRWPALSTSEKLPVHFYCVSPLFCFLVAALDVLTCVADARRRSPDARRALAERESETKKNESRTHAGRR